jgi:hypothetical protein
MVRNKEQELAFAGFFISHTLVDAEYCRQLILPAIEAVVHRGFNQYVFMDYENFGKGHKNDGTNAHLFAEGYAREIERLLNDSQAMFLVSSLAATHSLWVKYEVDWWVENRRLEELTIIIREPSDPCILNRAVRKCLQFVMYDPEDTVNAARLRARIGCFIPR